LMDADAAATCIFTLGSAEAEKFIQENHLRVLAIDSGLNCHDYCFKEAP